MTTPGNQVGKDPRQIPDHLTLDRLAEVYTRKQENLSARRANAVERLERARARLEPKKQAYRDRRGSEPRPGLFEATVTSAEQAVRRFDNIIDFLRPPSREDISYRKRVMDQFGSAVRAAIPRGLPLRFHGTPIYIARDILASGNLSSSVDRLGYATSHDTTDQVSVSTAKTLETTTGSYTGLSEEDFCVPSGCVFVLMPSSVEEAEAGHSSLLMNNVNFREEPEQLFTILTSPENMDTVRGWATTSGVDPSKVEEFFGFTERLSDLRVTIGLGHIAVQDLVPYPVPQNSRD